MIPKVFEDGTVTIVVGQEIGSCSIYINSMEIKYVTSCNVISDNINQKISIKFLKSDDKNLSMKIEESIRIVKILQWVKIE